MKRFVNITLIIAWRMAHNFYHNPALLFPALIFPLFFFCAFAGGLSSVSQVPTFNYEPGYTSFQLVFVLLQASAFAGVFTGFSIASDFERGFGGRLLLATPNRLALIAGFALGAAIRAGTVIVMIFVIGLITGARVTGEVGDVIGLILLALAMSQIAVLFAAGVALRARTLQAGPLMQLPVFLVMFLAPVYLPRHLLTGIVKQASSLNPVTVIIENARTLMAGQTPRIGLLLLTLGCLLGFFLVWAIRGLHKAEAATE